MSNEEKIQHKQTYVEYLKQLTSGLEKEIWDLQHLQVDLYASPPKLEPLDLSEVLMSGNGNGFEYVDGFTDGVLYAEKYHGIGVEE